jgi:deoxyadenosine/deoxycytidine kinase
MYILSITACGICSGKSTIAKILHDDYHASLICEYYLGITIILGGQE